MPDDSVFVNVENGTMVTAFGDAAICNCAHALTERVATGVGVGLGVAVGAVVGVFVGVGDADALADCAGVGDAVVGAALTKTGGVPEPPPAAARCDADGEHTECAEKT